MLDFQVLLFDKIIDVDYQLVIEEGMCQYLVEIEKIVDNLELVFFDNIFVVMEKFGVLFNWVMVVFNGVIGVNIDDMLQKVQEDEVLKFVVYEDVIYFNSKLFVWVELVYNQCVLFKFDFELLCLVEVVYCDFVYYGVKLFDVDKVKLKDFNKEELIFSIKFINILFVVIKDGVLVVDDKVKLVGFFDGDIVVVVVVVKDCKFDGKYVISLQNIMQQLVLQGLDDCVICEVLFKVLWNCVEKGDVNDICVIIECIVQICVEQVKLLGFFNYVVWKLEDQMVKMLSVVIKFMQDLVFVVIVCVVCEVKDIQDVIDV